jgi:hypothetical protein
MFESATGYDLPQKHRRIELFDFVRSSQRSRAGVVSATVRRRSRLAPQVRERSAFGVDRPLQVAGEGDCLDTSYGWPVGILHPSTESS